MYCIVYNVLYGIVAPHCRIPKDMKTRFGMDSDREPIENIFQGMADDTELLFPSGSVLSPSMPYHCPNETHQIPDVMYDTYQCMSPVSMEIPATSSLEELEVKQESWDHPLPQCSMYNPSDDAVFISLSLTHLKVLSFMRETG